MRINFKAFADFKLNGLKEAHIYKITHFTTKVRIFIVIGLLYIPLDPPPLRMSMRRSKMTIIHVLPCTGMLYGTLNTFRMKHPTP